MSFKTPDIMVEANPVISDMIVSIKPKSITNTPTSYRLLYMPNNKMPIAATLKANLAIEYLLKIFVLSRDNSNLSRRSFS